MKPTDILRSEHEAILVMLGILEKICTKLQAGAPVDPRHLDQILEFITTFTDRCHHGKEEKLLFPAMVEAGIPKEGGPIGVMLGEHEEGRYYVQEVSRALDRYRSDPKAATSVMEPLRLYISHLAQHIHKENRILFPMAEHYLSEEKQSELLIEFDEVEEQIIGKGKHEEFHALLDQLSKVYLK